MCRSLKKVQHIEANTSSAEEDNWDYNKIQKINTNKEKKDFYEAKLLVNEVPIKFIIDSGSPVTLSIILNCLFCAPIPNCLFNNKSQVEPLITTYRDVNNQNIEFIGQTQATMKTNNIKSIAVTDNQSDNNTADGIRLDATDRDKYGHREQRITNTKHPI